MEYCINYIESLQSIIELCDRLKEDTVKNYYTNDYYKTHPGFCYYPHYRKRFDLLRGVVEICDMIGVKHLEENKNTLRGRIQRLNDPAHLSERSKFEENISFVKNIFQVAEKEISERLSVLSPTETKRLDEAIHCYLEGCNNSTVAMAVCAIEYRLLALMRSKGAQLDEMTLGQLMREYLDNKEKYGNIIPKRHEPLLELCNTYGIFSVNPKKEIITRPTTITVLSSTLGFLLDPELPKESVGCYYPG
ncbi:MAG: hypothetical protein PHS47_01160 [Methanocellales archaeon]|nr:hypothetical protein [Methanocellales archaeon]MDD3291088.1 hypothetical protein [Methanocellales archaeon]MDD3420896.1 hypothetical protein [Methanocellales archaeon]MDD5234973.1 hypothetical protein [Methanocellales archaeon]MDD5484656.1 hypothetical protein [Methanocellales archaeon]